MEWGTELHRTDQKLKQALGSPEQEPRVPGERPETVGEAGEASEVGSPPG
eukprot:CAMPEP_0168495392 /NCGR_PEP_ID=MMETSP0228-20121227/71715_1 /TAXON_ID=133427 /ORGANISM="Protoceratium reticulatum, Strain CCCM 535 (=CCMP 1889)" /LENGTH=49 /DNA_ID= /DNA_START= /DNA_END= /DNA_ORIENTATION=